MTTEQPDDLRITTHHLPSIMAQFLYVAQNLPAVQARINALEEEVVMLRAEMTFDGAGWQASVKPGADGPKPS